MVVEQTVNCPHCNNEYTSQLEFADNEIDASEQCSSCRQTIFFRIQLDSTGNLDGIEIHPRKM